MPSNLSKAEFETLIQDAEVLEQDGFGLKVLRLPNERIIKLFRRKRLISSQLWAPHAWRFDRNAKILRKRKIPTISVESTFEIPEMERQAVIYKELPGTTLRDWLQKHSDSEAKEQIEAFAAFVAQLHAQGILFRSLHLGNVLVTPDNKLALIDIVDMGFRWFGALTIQQRMRNFKHIGRYADDRILIAQSGKDSFMTAYLENAQLPQNKHPMLINSFQESCG